MSKCKCLISFFLRHVAYTIKLQSPNLNRPTPVPNFVWCAPADIGQWTVHDEFTYSGSEDAPRVVPWFYRPTAIVFAVWMASHAFTPVLHRLSPPSGGNILSTLLNLYASGREGLLEIFLASAGEFAVYMLVVVGTSMLFTFMRVKPETGAVEAFSSAIPISSLPDEL